MKYRPGTILIPILIIFLMNPFIMPVQAENLFPSGSFEEASLSEGIPDGWEYPKAGHESFSVIEEETSPAPDSRHCLKISPDLGYLNIKTSPIPVDHEKPLLVSIWIKGSQGPAATPTVGVRMEWLDEGGNLIKWHGGDHLRSNVYVGASRSPEWTLIEREFLPKGSETHPAFGIPTTAVACQITLLGELAETPVFIDDLVLEQDS